MPFALITVTHQALADGSCLTLNNGGTTTRQICLTPSPSNAPANQTTTQSQQQQQPQQNSNGQHVFPTSANTKTTPNTGPDDWSLPVLFLLGGFGFLLRNKAKQPLSN